MNKKLQGLIILFLLINRVVFAQQYEFANQQSNGTSTSGCTSCSITNPLLAVDNDPETRSVLTTQAGIRGGYVEQFLIFKSPSCSKDTIYLKLGLSGALADSNLNSIMLTTFNGTVANSDNIIVSQSGIKQSDTTFIFKFATPNIYTKVRVRFTINAGTFSRSLYIYYATRFRDTYNVISGTTSLCSGDSTILSLSPTRSLVSYDWYKHKTGPDTLLHSGNSNFHTGGLTQTTTYYLQRCTGNERDSITITINQKPVLPTFTGNTVICKGQTTKLTAHSTDGGANFKWIDSATNQELGTTILNTPVLDKDTVYHLYSFIGGCRTDDPVSVRIKVELPLDTPIVDCGEPTINSITFRWNSIPGATKYRISKNFGSTWESPTVATDTTISGLALGTTMTIIVQAMGPLPCGNSAFSIPVTCKAVACVPVDFDLDDPNIVRACMESMAQLKVYNVTSTSYEVSWDHSQFIVGDTYNYKVTENKTIDVVVRNPDQPGCPSTVKKLNIVVLDTPVVIFSSDKTVVTINDEDVQFFDQTSGSISREWDFGDGNTSTEQYPKHRYRIPGKYTIKLKVTNQDGCVSQIVSKEYINAEFAPDLIMPNTFTPNGDGLNDKLQVNQRRIQKYHIRIYNPTGILVYESYDITEGWDGMNNNMLQPIGAYFYIVSALSDDNKQFDKKGIINLVR